MEDKRYLLNFFTEKGKLQHRITSCPPGDIPLAVLQHQVDGHIEMVYYCDFGDDTLCAVVDETALMKKKPATFYIVLEDGSVQQYPLVGNVLVVKEHGSELHGLTADEVKSAMSSVYTDDDNRHYFLKINQAYYKNALDISSILSSFGIEEYTLNPGEDIDEHYNLD